MPLAEDHTICQSLRSEAAGSKTLNCTTATQDQLCVWQDASLLESGSGGQVSCLIVYVLILTATYLLVCGYA